MSQTIKNIDEHSIEIYDDDYCNGLRPFVITFEKFPTLPFKCLGEYQTIGWDIATLYAIDSDNNCWVNNAHGGSLNPCSQDYLINDPDSEFYKNKIKEILGIVEIPFWVETAKRYGWTPPEGWQDEDALKAPKK